MLTLKQLRTLRLVSILIDHHQGGTDEHPDDQLRSKHVGMFLSVLKLTFRLIYYCIESALVGV